MPSLVPTTILHAFPTRRSSDLSFFGLINTQVWSLIRRRRFDAVVVYTGYMYFTFWIALVAAKLSGVPILFGTDAHQLESRDRKPWKARVKRSLWPRLFKLSDQVLVS